MRDIGDQWPHGITIGLARSRRHSPLPLNCVMYAIRMMAPISKSICQYIHEEFRVRA